MGESVTERLNRCRRLLIEFLRAFPSPEVGVAWAGGTDGLLLLNLVHQVSEDLSADSFQFAFVDEGPFATGKKTSVANRLSERLGLSTTVLRNDDFLKRIASGKSAVHVERLGERNRLYLEESGFEDEILRLDRDADQVRLLTRRVPLEHWVEARGLLALVSEVRDGEGDAADRFECRILAGGGTYECLRPLGGFSRDEIHQLVSASQVAAVAEEGQATGRLDREVSLVSRPTGDASRGEGGIPESDDDTPEDQDEIIEQLRDLGYI